MISSENAIVVEGLTKRFGSFTAVDRISFDVKKGEIFGFLGANGAGKSTTIRMLCALLQSSDGSALVAELCQQKLPLGRSYPVLQQHWPPAPCSGRA